ncbi:ComEC/Rec2 family competence protein [Fictibacillus phosphorivorans]|uniref:ComEC/Rec2 family competence protein n=1 Tax=Fictibacillus phosphorivorans TaxID=1221500 RepID=UPI00203B5289|nr:ComEC/Rec2 family competence protein [Fictibacillus phosphorivorans]MCM3717580.1 MBL fold metallo-hydrolase [Fictibacillus phosphorivorans]MCM3775275.1 MBL fold metallo-hydrolase [Fictibacillus phosphorivorans]
MNKFNKSAASVLCFILVWMFIPGKPVHADWFDPLKIHFLDVGQADCILVEAPNGQTMLIDGGDEHDAEEIITYLKREGITRLDIVVASHPHHDHIGSLDDVIREFPVSVLYMPNLPYDTKYYHDLFRVINEKQIPVDRAKAGVHFKMGFSVKVEMLAPRGSYYKHINDYSAVIKIQHGKKNFLLMADAGAEEEKEIMSRGGIKADVIKIGHHGANTGTSMEFLKKVKAKTAVISVGKHNPYQFPSKEVLYRLNNRKMTVYRTDQLGAIIATSNGKKIMFRTNALH